MVRNEQVRVLIVDDEFISNLIMTKNLNNFEGIEIETFTNGKEIKDYLKATPEETAIFLFLDLRMPVMTGFEFLDWYEQNRTHKNLCS